MFSPEADAVFAETIPGTRPVSGGVVSGEEVKFLHVPGGAA